MIRYVTRAMRNPSTQVVKYYPQPASLNPLTLNGVVEQIERQCTVSEPDIKAVINALEYVVIQALKNGQSVRLGDLGSFRFTMTTEGAATAKEVKASLIKKLNVRFTPSGAMRKKLKVENVEFAALTSAADSGSDDNGETA